MLLLIRLTSTCFDAGITVFRYNVSQDSYSPENLEITFKGYDSNTGEGWRDTTGNYLAGDTVPKDVDGNNIMFGIDGPTATLVSPGNGASSRYHW